MTLDTLVYDALDMFLKQEINEDKEMLKDLENIIATLHGTEIFPFTNLDATIKEIQGSLMADQYWNLPLDYKLYRLLEALEMNSKLSHLCVHFLLRFFIFCAEQCKKFKYIVYLRDGDSDKTEEFKMATSLFAKATEEWREKGVEFPIDLVVKAFKCDFMSP